MRGPGWTLLVPVIAVLVDGGHTHGVCETPRFTPGIPGSLRLSRRAVYGIAVVLGS